MFELKDVAFGYAPGSLLFENINLHIRKNDFILLKGPSGAGKSSFLRLLNNLEVPLKGEILFNGKPLTSYESTALRRRVVYLQQIPIMLDTTVRENLLLPFRFASARGLVGPPDKVMEDQLRAFLLDGVSLNKNAAELSVGQKQRLALIRAVLLKPEALLLDEPTASLDHESRAVVEQHVERLNQAGITVIMVNHTDYIPQRVEPRVLVLQNGAMTEVCK